jgi:hypothetical protein
LATQKEKKALNRHKHNIHPCQQHTQHTHLPATYTTVLKDISLNKKNPEPATYTTYTTGELWYP